MAKASALSGLLVNGVANPLAVDRDSVRFAWRMESGAAGARGQAQTGWQIRVASSPQRLEQGQADFWDSGKVVSAESAAVEYAGEKLPAASRFWWDVRAWDQDGNPGTRSAPAFFDTGLGQGDWSARYIWDGTDNPNNFAYFRKMFSVTEKPALAKVFVTAHDDYMLFFNGRFVGRGPARNDPYRRGQYNSYDITGLVRTGGGAEGVNVFAVVARWHGMWNNNGVIAKPAFLLEARFVRPDGSCQTIGTDASWRALADTGYIESDATYFSSRNPRRVPDSVNRPEPEGGWITELDSREFASATVVVREDANNRYVPYGGAAGSRNRPAIRFDALREPAGWKSAEFDDSGWAAANVVERPDYRLFAQMAPAVNEQAELEPVGVAAVEATAGTRAWLVDFGRCINGWPKLAMRNNCAGDIIRVEYFQRKGQLNPAGWDEYTCRGGDETWHPNFGRQTSFQEIKITGYAGELSVADVRGIWAYCDADVGGRFRCSSKALNEIYEMCERSARQNTQQGIISVDANREQSQWTADCWNIGNVLLYNHRGTTIIDGIIRAYAAVQLPNGNFPACAPAQRSRCIPEWSMYWPMLLWKQYLFSGDIALLREMSPRLERFLSWLKQYQDADTKLIDPPGWRISEYAGGNMPSGGVNTATNCQYYENLRIAARIHAVLGQGAQSEDCSRQAQEVKNAINTRLFNDSFYIARIGTQDNEMFPGATAWALRFGIAPEADRKKLLATIARHPAPKLGGYGGDAFYSGLLHSGGGARVVRDMPARYRPMLQGNRANWENLHGGGEFNHAWTAYPGYLFQKYILGIQPTSGGFATFDVRPETGGLTFAEGAVPSVKGDILTRWEKSEGGRLRISITVPANTRACVHIPKLGREVTVMESGAALWPETREAGEMKETEGRVRGVISVTEDEEFVRCEVEAGEYEFLAASG